MQEYHFVTHWFFDAPVERVWQELVNAQAWPQWWRCWKQANVHPSAHGSLVGATIDNVVQGKLPYSLRFATTITAVELYKSIELESSGELVGKGRFVFEPRAAGTAVTYYWDIATVNPLFNLFGKLSFVRQMISDNHDYVMADGYRGLKPRVEAQPAKTTSAQT